MFNWLDTHEQEQPLTAFEGIAIATGPQHVAVILFVAVKSCGHARKIIVSRAVNCNWLTEQLFLKFQYSIIPP